jgi:aspartyl-tRNA(Asn)/glutamyl-tRNA(Gln) amidotransferase subunit C
VISGTKTKLDEAAVRHVAHLARLAVTDAEVGLYAEQLSKILDYVNQLNEVDTTDVPPTAHPLPIANVFRDDAPHQPWTPDAALANAPDHQNGFFRVPKVLADA